MKEELCKDMFFSALNDYNQRMYDASFDKFKIAAYEYKANSMYEVHAKYYLALLYKNFKNDNINANNLFKQVEQSDSKYSYNSKYHLALYYHKEKKQNKACGLFKQVAESDSEYDDDAKYMLAKFYKNKVRNVYDLYKELSTCESIKRML
ncbi:6987_t:CDS:1 [Gigaspora margarita]|uniref:6987_t:CDS:1 n=1 Tax=Gigaspora margarita TaxID=4874 RepID=A0ABN7VEX0_GIGMA|nr:6987_t:CDS:1 [Gigaspora margarita]